MAQAKTVSGEGGEGIVQKAKGFVLLVVGGQTHKVSTRGVGIQELCITFCCHNI